MQKLKATFSSFRQVITRPVRRRQSLDRRTYGRAGHSFRHEFDRHRAVAELPKPARGGTSATRGVDGQVGRQGLDVPSFLRAQAVHGPLGSLQEGDDTLGPQDGDVGDDSDPRCNMNLEQRSTESRKNLTELEAGSSAPCMMPSQAFSTVEAQGTGTLRIARQAGEKPIHDRAVVQEPNIPMRCLGHTPARLGRAGKSIPIYQ